MKSIIITILLFCLVLNMASCVIPIPGSPQQSTPADAPTNQTPVVPIDPDWSPETEINNNPPLPSIADVVEKVFPSVVAITTEVVTLDFFSQPQTREGAGSGWIIDKDGIIVTNNHVVEGAKKVTIELANGQTFQVGPDRIRRDSVTDLAIIKIDATNLPAATLADSTKLRVGEWVVALGNPLGQGLRAKEGTISGLKVSLPVDQGETLYDLIETSAAINPGNSGGPLVNMRGQVVGITSAKISAVGVEGLGYAISEYMATPIIEQLITRGYVIRPWLGIAPITVNQYVATVNRLPVNKGVVIAYVFPGGPADKAGLKELDVISHFNDKEVLTAEALVQNIRSLKVGEEVGITFIRDTSSQTVHARLEQSRPPSN